MMTAVPLTSFHGWRKQIEPSALDSLQRLALETLFPGFAPPDPEAVNRSVRQARRASMATRVIGEYVNPRRYAGDWTLSRGRYFTVAKDSSGLDYGTLLAELAAYYELEAGPATLDEFFSAEKAAEERVEYHPHQIVVRLGGTPGSSAALAKLGTETVCIPYRVEQSMIDDVLDLRIPEAQEWLWMRFRDINRVAYKDLGTRPSTDASTFQPDSFFAMLPTLMSSERGGNHVTQIIGVWLRQHHVAGLIYPTARKAAGVAWRNGKMTGFAGWDLVDYRGAADVFLDNTLVLGSPWIEQFSPDYKVQREEDSQTWQVTPPRGYFQRSDGVVRDHDLRARFDAGAEVFNLLFETAWRFSDGPTLTSKAVIAATRTDRGRDVLAYMGIRRVRVHLFENQDAVLFECSTAVRELDFLSKGFAYLEVSPHHAVTSVDTIPQEYQTGQIAVVTLEAGMHIYFLCEPAATDDASARADLAQES
jgi:hypothetical protein